MDVSEPPVKKQRGKPFPKGNPGRPVGCESKKKKAFKEVMQALLETNEENFEAWIKKIAKRNPRAAYDLLLRSAEFVAPKLNRTEMSGTPDGNPILVKRVVDDISGSIAKDTDSGTIPPKPSST